MSIHERLHTDGEKDYAWHNSERQIKMNVYKQTGGSTITSLEMRLTWHLMPDYIWHDCMKNWSSFTYCTSKWVWMPVWNCNTIAKFFSLDENSIKYCWALGIYAFGPSGKYEILALIQSKLLQSGFNKVQYVFGKNWTPFFATCEWPELRRLTPNRYMASYSLGCYQVWFLHLGILLCLFMFLLPVMN